MVNAAFPIRSERGELSATRSAATRHARKRAQPATPELSLLSKHPNYRIDLILDSGVHETFGSSQT
jgi:hypothetical protein